MKENYSAGDTLVLRLRKDDTDLMEWAGKQSQLGDSIRFLIEQEINQSGLKDLATEISSKRVYDDVPRSSKILPFLLELLYERGEIKVNDAYEELATKLNLREEQKNKTVRSGDESLFENNVRWARNTLRSKQYLTSVDRGVWKITELGKENYVRSKEYIIKKMVSDGYINEANELSEYQDKNGNNFGWNGWLKGRFPKIADRYGVHSN